MARKCKICKQPYQPMNTLQTACQPKCALELARKAQERRYHEISREARVRLRAARIKLKTRSDWLKGAQTAFNAFIRARDAKLPCVSCGRFHEGQWHAGHYRTTAAAPVQLRFDELNCHRQCAPCNSYKSGDIVNYRATLIERIGAEGVEYLEGPHPARHYTIDDLKEIKIAYKRKLKELQR